jgi:hypothetical protein
MEVTGKSLTDAAIKSALITQASEICEGEDKLCDGKL